MSDEIRVGFIGLGTMGNPMSRRILGAGFPLVVYDVRSTPVEGLVASGASAAGSPKEVAERADVVLTSLPSLKACDDVYFGPNGLLNGAHEGQVLVETSTVPPKTVRHVADEARRLGVGVVDAALLSKTDFHPGLNKLTSSEIAARGQIMLMAGGETSDLSKVHQVLSAFGDPIFHMGPVGSGTMIKVLQNAITHAYFAVACEVFAVAAKSGIDLQKLEEIFQHTSARSGALNDNLAPLLKTGRGKSMSVEAGVKDSEAMLEVARELNVPMFMQSANHAYYQLAYHNCIAKELPWDGEVTKLFEGFIGKEMRFP